MEALFTGVSPVEQVNKTCARLGIKPGERLLAVRISTADPAIFPPVQLVKTYVISTSKRPPSNLKNSLGTPRGLHEIAERIGAGQPPGMVFKARVPTGRHFNELPRTPEADNDQPHHLSRDPMAARAWNPA
jgi:hypothetical protein